MIHHMSGSKVCPVLSKFTGRIRDDFLFDLLHIKTCPFTSDAALIGIENRANLSPQNVVQLAFGIPR